MGICGCKQLPAEPGQITINAKQKEDMSQGKTEEKEDLDKVRNKDEEYFVVNAKPSTHLDNPYSNNKIKAAGMDEEKIYVKQIEESKPLNYQTAPYADSNNENKNTFSKETRANNEWKAPTVQEAIKEVKIEKEEQRYNGYQSSAMREQVEVEPVQTYTKKKAGKKGEKTDKADEGDESFGYEYDNDDYGAGEDEEEIEIENTYFEADDKKNSRPKDAIEGFQTVIMLEENRSERKYTFQSLLNIILIKCKLQLYSDLSDDVTKILKAMDKVSKNDANDAINSILEALLNLEDQNQADKAIVKILDYLKEKNYEQLWLNASIRLCKIYLDRKEYTQFQNLIESIKESCRLPDGTDDMKKSSVLLEVYSLEINLHMQTMNLAKIKEIYDKTKNISSAIADPRTMGIIKETHGKMLMIEKDWENARLELFEAFKYYQEVGSIKAKSMLKYVVIVSILAQSSLNPFDNVEAKVYREDAEIKLMDNLRTAYEQKNGKELIRIMGSQKYKIFDEPFIQQFEEDLMNIMCLEMIVALAAPYKKMKFDYLQRELNLNEKQVECYISRLILDKKLCGKIDLVEGYFENYNANRNTVEEKKNEALFHWIKSLANVNVY